MRRFVYEIFRLSSLKLQQIPFSTKIITRKCCKSESSFCFSPKLEKKSSIILPRKKHNDGTDAPSIGLGTYMTNGPVSEQSVCDAIDVGYRYIDTAYFYENEHNVGAAIKEKVEEGVIKREDMFIVSKLWCHFHEPERVEHACRLSLQFLGLDYIDLYLMNWPYSYVYRGDEVLVPLNNGKIEFIDVDYLDTWYAMEELVDKGLVKSIGVSNFNSRQLQRIVEKCNIKPIHNQIECHPALVQRDLIECCRQHGVVVTAYSPLCRANADLKRPKFLFDAKTVEIAEKHGKTPAQIVLRYLIENHTLPIPKSLNKAHMIENINVFDFHLDECDHETMNDFNTGARLVRMLSASESKYYPFRDEVENKLIKNCFKKVSLK